MLGEVGRGAGGALTGPQHLQQAQVALEQLRVSARATVVHTWCRCLHHLGEDSKSKIGEAATT